MFAVLTRVVVVVSRTPMRVRVRVLMIVGMGVAGTAMQVFVGMRVTMSVWAFHDLS
jgi:hypothetical protein